MKGLISFAAVGALCLSAQAQAAAQSCITAQEVEGMAGYFLPTVAKQVQSECAAALPADSYMRTGFVTWVADLDAVHESYWSAAKAGFLKFMAKDGKPDKDMMAAMAESDDALKGVIGIALAAKMKLNLKPDDCAEVNDIVEAFAPLKPAQSVTLVARVFSAAMRKDKRLPACPRT